MGTFANKATAVQSNKQWPSILHIFVTALGTLNLQN